jgi:hypothetical protein
LQPMRDGRNHCGGAFIDGKFYVVGGRRRVHAFDSNEVYDPQTNTWERMWLPPHVGASNWARLTGSSSSLAVKRFPNAAAGPRWGRSLQPATNTWRSLSPS